MDYRLPRDVRDRLAAALADRRNKDACLALATFIARFWTAPRKLGLPFMLDRRALAPIEALGLTEARVRGAIRALERVGFIERMPASGRTHQATPGGLHRKPAAFTIGADYRDAFDMANKRAQAARDRRSRVGRALCEAPATPQPPSTLSSQRLGPRTRPNTIPAKRLGLFGQELIQDLQHHPYKTQNWRPPWTAGDWLSRKPRPERSAVRLAKARASSGAWFKPGRMANLAGAA